jgi:TIGR03009 family protein
MKISLYGWTGWMCCALLFAGTLNAWQTDIANQQQPADGQAASTPETGNYNQQLRQQQQAAGMVQQPTGFPLPPQDQQYIQQLLEYWEKTSQDIDRYRCNFTRWQYDHVAVNYRNPANNQLVAAMISKGKVRYSKPDQGMYEVLEMWQFSGPPDEEGGDPKYVRPAALNPNAVETEKWICDGAKIYEYDYQNKRLYELTLPPEAQGEGLKNSPLPFVFGAKAAELQERFWIRDVTPQSLHGQQYWLECWPKRINDAQAYSKVEIILSRQPFLPVSIHMYAPNYDQKTNPQKMVFQFEERQINGALDNLADFMQNFINPRTPFGWDRVPRELMQEPEETGPPRVGQVPPAGKR